MSFKEFKEKIKRIQGVLFEFLENEFYENYVKAVLN